MHFRVTGEWNGEPFNRVIEAAKATLGTALFTELKNKAMMRLKSFMCRRELKTHGAMLASVIMMVYNKHITTIASLISSPNL